MTSGEQSRTKAFFLSCTVHLGMIALWALIPLHVSVRLASVEARTVLGLRMREESCSCSQGACTLTTQERWGRPRRVRRCTQAPPDGPKKRRLCEEENQKA